jgi:hypothetical protein
MNRRVAWVSITAALALSCSKPSETPAAPSSTGTVPPSTAVVPPAEPGPPTAPASASDVPPAPPASAEAVDKPVPEACMKECVARNQMRAEAAQKIEADCRKECR